MRDKQPGIVFVVPYRFIPPVNGGHKAAYGFADFMNRKLPLIALTTSDNPEADTPFPVVRLLGQHFTKYISPMVAWRCWRFFKNQKPTHCFTHQHFIALLLIPILTLLGIPLTIYVQNIEYQRFKTMKKWFWPIIYLSEKLAYKGAKQLFFISPDDLGPACSIFHLNEKKCTVLPYGTYLNASPADREKARMAVEEQHGFSKEEFLILFFGPQSYQPNLEAVELIINKINPLLLQKVDFAYRFIICGGGLPQSYNKLMAYREQHVEYLGFVEDIDQYIKAADLMINPVNTGGGVKTKLLEAIALGTTVLSSETGAKGVETEHCGEKLIQVGDEDLNAYCAAIIQQKQKPQIDTPAAFYEYYYWENIVNRTEIP